MRRYTAILLMLIALFQAAPLALAIAPVQTPAPSLDISGPVDGRAWGDRFALAFSAARGERFAVVDEQALYEDCFFQGELEGVVGVLVHALAPVENADYYIVEVALNYARLPSSETDRLLACFEEAIRSALAASAYENSAAGSVPAAAIAYLTQRAAEGGTGRGFVRDRIYESSRISADIGIDYDRNGAWYCILTIEK